MKRTMMTMVAAAAMLVALPLGAAPVEHSLGVRADGTRGPVKNLRTATDVVGTLPNGRQIHLKRKLVKFPEGFTPCSGHVAAQRMVEGAKNLRLAADALGRGDAQTAEALMDATKMPKASGGSGYDIPNNLIVPFNQGCTYIDGTVTDSDNARVLFYDDFAYVEFNLDKVQYKLRTLIPSNKSYNGLYAFQPYGHDYPYYDDLVESDMVNPDPIMILDARDPNDGYIGAAPCGVTITWPNEDGTTTTEDIYMMSLNYCYANLFNNGDAAGTYDTIHKLGIGATNDGQHVKFYSTESIIFTTPQLIDLAEGPENGINVYVMNVDGDYGFDFPNAEADDSPAYDVTLTPEHYAVFDGSLPVHFKCGKLISSLGVAFYLYDSFTALMQTDDLKADIFNHGNMVEMGYQAEGTVTMDSGEEWDHFTDIYVVCLGGDANGNVKGFGYADFVGVPRGYDSVNWTSLGNFKMTDGIVGNCYPDLAGGEWSVEVQENKQTPGLYRIVDPYNAHNLKNNYGGSYDLPEYSGKHFFITIDATDPTAVVLEKSPLGINPYQEPYADDTGEMEASSFAAQYITVEGWTKDQCRQNRLTGTLTNGVITFPKGALLYRDNGSYLNNEWYKANKNGEFKLDLSKAAGIEEVNLEEAAQPAEYYDLQGRRLNAAPAEGLYLEKRGATVSKRG